MRIADNSEAKLRIILIEITQKCNAACDHCGSRCDINCEEILTKEEIINALRDVKENIGTDVMINISGGEPLLRRDLFEIMSEVHDMGFDWGMVTNGTLITDDVIEKMKKSGMSTITVSVDGLQENHEALRHLPGSFERIMTNLEKLKRARFLDCLQVTFTSNKKNYKDFPGLYDRLKRIGIDSVRTSFIDPIGRAQDNAELLMGREEMKYVIDFANHCNENDTLPVEWGCCHFLGTKLKNRTFKCFAGIYIASILYNGDIFVCPNVPRIPELIQGNIKTDSLSQVWREGFKFFRNKPLPDKCKECKYLDKCDCDSVHTFDFEKNEPRFCYRDIFDVNVKRYESWLTKTYDAQLIRVCDEPAPAIYIEPGAWEEIRTYFHMGRKHPQSYFEQQMGLVGFKIDGDYVVRYTFPAHINQLAADLSTFKADTVSDAIKQTSLIKRSMKYCDDRLLPGADKMRFLGFVHSHPVQEELCYSIGDEILHRRLYKKFGDYIGLLVNPEHDLFGAYVGCEDIVQGDLRIAQRR